MKSKSIESIYNRLAELKTELKQRNQNVELAKAAMAELEEVTDSDGKMTIKEALIERMKRGIDSPAIEEMLHKSPVISVPNYH